MKTRFVGMKVLLFAGLMASASLATAADSSGVMVQIAGFMKNQSAKVEYGATSETDTQESTYDFNLGYLNSSGLYLGATQSSYKGVEKSNGATVSDPTGTATGLSAGYFGNNGLYVRLNYYLSAQYDDDYKKGSGYQLDIGYMGRVAGSFFLGVQLAQQSLTFTENDSIPGFEKLTLTDLRPMFTMGFLF